jgi:hypothetical protein
MINAEIRFQSCMSGVRFWEVEVEKGDRSKRINVYLSDMKKRGVAKTLNATRKLDQWLNFTEEGQKFLEEQMS